MSYIQESYNMNLNLKEHDIKTIEHGHQTKPNSRISNFQRTRIHTNHIAGTREAASNDIVIHVTHGMIQES